MPAAVVQPSTVSLPAAPDSVTVNSTSSPSAALASATETIAVPESTIVVVAAVESTVTVPAVLAPVRVTINVSPGSTTLSELVWSVIVPLDAPAVMVNEPLGAV